MKEITHNKNRTEESRRNGWCCWVRKDDRIDTKNEEQKEYSETLKRSTEGVSDIDSHPSFMLPGVESRFQVGGLEGRWNVGWRKARKICDERNSAEMLPEFQQTQLLYPWIYIFFSTHISCSLCYTVHQNMNAIEKIGSRGVCLYSMRVLPKLRWLCGCVPARYLQKNVPMWRSVVMDWRRAILHTIFSLWVASHSWLLFVSSSKSDGACIQ